MKTKELLMKDYKNASDLSGLVKDDPAKLEVVMRERDNIRNELIKMESVEIDKKYRKEEIEAENKRTWVRIAVDSGIAIITFIGSCYWIRKTFEFDEKGTITSTLGRGILGNIIPRAKK